MNKLNDKNKIRNSRKELTNSEITEALKDWLIAAEDVRKTKLQNFNLLGYDNSELSGDDCLHKSGLLYQVIKENFTESLNIISMLYGYKHNVYENFNFVDGYIEKERDFSIFG